jgi:hypothetical protein
MTDAIEATALLHSTYHLPLTTVFFAFNTSHALSARLTCMF